ncbi:apextrin [Elysia marginata]|uniref:Apextrin n=1 Tax=Elysia marginata TaxID=1093978 RepID=A0AAV4IYE8_9GAST|nr:apextrin [Elysia marginata]
MILHQAGLLVSLLVLALQRGLALPVQDVSDPSLPFQLTVTPALVTRYTAKEMSLRCEHNPDVPTQLTNIFRMRIVKQSTSVWELVAEQRELLARPTVAGNITASANINGTISNAFLHVAYPSIGPDCFGVFKCEATGFDGKDEVLTERSSTIAVHEFKNFIHHLIGLSVDTQENVLEMENFTDTEIARLDNGLQRLRKSIETNQTAIENNIEGVESKVDSLTQHGISTDTEISQLKKDLQDQQNAVRTNLSIHETRIGRMESNQVSYEDRIATLETFLVNQKLWPAGRYALPKPKNGCPLDLAFHGGTNSFLKIHTQSEFTLDPEDSHSSAFSSQTISTVNGKKFVTLEFCEVTTPFNTMTWPQGTFCINKEVSWSCPTGFNYGYVRVDSEDFQPAGEGRNNVAHDVNNPYLYFCCQNTGSANVPIQLPTHSAFLLYRYRGVCQAVQGMKVSEEYVQMNTEDHGDNDNELSGSHPDIYQPGSSALKLNLCYYTKL